MLQEARRWLQQLIFHHVVKNSAHCKKTFRRHAQVRQSIIVHQDLLDYESCNCLGQVSATLHNSQAQWNYLRLQQKGDHFSVVDFDKGADHTK